MSTRYRSQQAAQQTESPGVTISPESSSTDPANAVLPALSWRVRLVGLAAAVALAWSFAYAFSFLAWVAA